MVTPALNTILKMIEQLPESEQDRVVEHLREYLAEMEDEETWNQSFSKTQKQLVHAAREARKQVAEGKARPMDFNKPRHEAGLLLSLPLLSVKKRMLY